MSHSSEPFTAPRSDEPTASAGHSLSVGPSVSAPSVEPSTRAKRTRKRRIISIGVVLTVVALFIVGLIPVDKVIESPGPTFNVLGSTDEGGKEVPVIQVDGAPTYPTTGELRMTTVGVRGCPGYPVRVIDWVIASLSSSQKVIDRDLVCPKTMTREEVDSISTAQMTSSQDAAVVAALLYTGVATSMKLTVAGLAPEQDAALQKGDVLASIKTPGEETATPIETYAQLRELLTTIPPHTTVTLTVMRDGQPIDVSLTTVEPPEGVDGSLLGVYLTPSANSDVSAHFGLEDVGGPSAGMMFTLGLIDQLTQEDLTGGQKIAGTGTIDASGNIGPIGGIQQKMIGAKGSGVNYFLAPTSNCDEVVGHVPDGMQAFAVATLDDAVTTVKGIAAQSTDSLMTCEQVQEQAQ
ncbi:YlbL family protein [Actinomyces vulturis]|uniref:YlbL family protein n=1 Tax=Actinomyces vulturis TaxID=1857645 RepID=UPI00159EDD11|nr:S16 family serine protease [Actinomyces vulturis]